MHMVIFSRNQVINSFQWNCPFRCFFSFFTPFSQLLTTTIHWWSCLQAFFTFSHQPKEIKNQRTNLYCSVANKECKLKFINNLKYYAGNNSGNKSDKCMLYTYIYACIFSFSIHWWWQRSWVAWKKVICLEFENVFFSLEPDVHQRGKRKGRRFLVIKCECLCESVCVLYLQFTNQVHKRPSMPKNPLLQATVGDKNVA